MGGINKKVEISNKNNENNIEKPQKGKQMNKSTSKKEINAKVQIKRQQEQTVRVHEQPHHKEKSQYQQEIEQQQRYIQIQNKLTTNNYQSTPKILELDIEKKENIELNYRKSMHLNTFGSNTSLQETYDPNKSSKLLKQLILQNISVSQVKLIKTLEKKRTIILWLKMGAGTQKQNQRDRVLIDRGYQIYSNNQIKNIKLKYQQSSSVSLRLATHILFSYSDHYNNQQTLKQMYEYFILLGKLNKIFIVKPYDQTSYRMHLSGIRQSKSIVELPYQIELIKQKIAQYQYSQNHSSVNFLPLKVWQNIKGLKQIYQQYSILETTMTKAKVSLNGCLRIGSTLIDQLQQKTYFKNMVKIYTFFHDLYLSESLLMKQIKKDENYLRRIGLKLLQDPVNFYLTPTHQLAINRILKYSIDIPEYVNNIILPLNLLFFKIKQQHRKDCDSKQYRNQFISYYQTNLTQQQINYLQKDVIIENLGFIKANLKQYDLKKMQNNTKTNGLFIINVRPTAKDPQADNGYYFIGENHKDIEQQQSQNKTYFSGFSYVVFNLLNNFIVRSHHFDQNLKKHIIQLQYGYIQSEIYKRNVVNYISQEQYAPRYIKIQQQAQVDYASIIKYQTNKQILDKIEDHGDTLTLLTRYNDSISYYDYIFAKCKTQIGHDVLLLSSFQNKKGLNLQLGKSSQTALQYFYNAFNFVRKIRRYTHIQINVIKCLERTQEYQRMVTFTENLIQIAKKYKFIDTIERQYLLQLYRLIAKGHFLRNSINYGLQQHIPEIMKNYELGIKIIDEMGQYNPAVPEFYYDLGTYYLSVGKTFDALVYLNKALIIKMTILTENHPQLCPFHQIIAVAYVGMHDYGKALNSINSAFSIYEKYYQKRNYRFLVVYEMRGKIYALMNKIQNAIQSFEAQEQIIHHYLQKKRYIVPNQRRYSIYNAHIALFNLIEQKQLNPYFCNRFRKDRAQICKVYVLLYGAKILKLQYKFKKVNDLLTQAFTLNTQELGQASILNVQILLLTAEALIQSLKWKQSQKRLRQALQILSKIRKERGTEAVRCFQIYAKHYEQKRDYRNCLTYLLKAKQLNFKLYSRNSLQNCTISSKIGKINLKIDCIPQSKAYFAEHESALKVMLLKAKNDPKSTNLIESSLQKYIKQIEIQSALSMQNKAMLLQKCGQIDEAILKYKQSIQSLKLILGEYHPKMGKVIYRLGCCYLKKGTDQFDRALQQLKKSYSIFKSADTYNLVERVQIHISLSKAYEAKNELPTSAEDLGHAINLLKEMHKIGIDFLQILVQINRIVNIIMNQPTINYLKSTYFTISKIFSQERDLILKQELTKHYEGQYQRQICNQIQQLLKKQEQMQRHIQSIETKQIREERDLLKRLEEQDHHISIQKIKQNYQIRKQLRTKVQS